MPTRYPALILSQAPTHFWRCTEVSGNLADLGSSPSSASTTNLTYQQTGPTGADLGLLYDGVGVEQISAGSGTSFPDGSTSAWTLSMWYKPTDRAASYPLAARDNTGSIGWVWYVQATTGLPWWGKLTGSPSFFATNAPAVGVWSHLALTVSLSGGVYTVTHYLNGVQNGSGTVTKGSDFTVGSTVGFSWGNVGYTATSTKAALTDLAIWNGTVLSGTAITAQYNAGASAPAPTTFYVRKTGSNANDGLTPLTAWATLGKLFALSSGIVGGDTIYVGAGIYRETIATAAVTFDNPASEVQVIGDVTGQYTGDTGPVIWNNWLAGDTAAPTNNSLFQANSKDYLHFRQMCFMVQAVSVGFVSAMGNHWRFTACRFQYTGAVVGLAGTAVQGADKDLIVDRCIAANIAAASGAIFVQITYTQNAVAEYEATVIVKNSFFYGFVEAVIANAASGSGAFKGNGGRLMGCTLWNCNEGVYASTNGASVQYALQCINCVLIGGNSIRDLNTSGGAIGENNYSVTPTAPTGAEGLLARHGDARSCYLDLGEMALWGLGTNPLATPYQTAYTNLPLLPSAPIGLAVGRGGTSSEDASLGTTVWTTPEGANLFADTPTAVSAAMAQNEITRYLKLVGNVSVPAGATIRAVRVQASGVASAVSSVRASSVRLVMAGTIAGNNLASSNTALFSTTTTVPVWGSAADPLWGLALTAADVNDPNFGCVIAFTNINAATRTVTIGGLRVIVAYEAAGAYYEQAVDLLNRPRPAGMLQISAQVGALEVHDTGVKEATVKHGDAAALKLLGPGDQQFDIPVGPTATTITVWARYDSNHGGTLKPQAVLLAEDSLGVSQITATMTAAADTWEQLTIGSFTPTMKGIVTLRLRNRSATANGLAYFDDIEVE